MKIPYLNVAFGMFLTLASLPAQDADMGPQEAPTTEEAAVSPEDAPPPADSPTTPEPAEPAPAEIVPETRNAYTLLVRERLEVGTRTLSRSYKETKRGNRETREGTYFGTINEIRVDEDGSFDRLYLQYRLHTYLGLGVTWDDHNLQTRDGPLPTNTDGDFVIDSTYYYVFARYPLPYGFVPFAEYGRGSHDISFTAEPNWGRRNSIVIADESVSASFHTIGLEYHITRNVSVHVMRRWTSFSFDADYRNIDGRPPLPFTINSDQTITGFGLKVTF